GRSASADRRSLGGGWLAGSQRNLVERANDGMSVLRRDGIAGALGQAGLHACRARRIELADNIGNEQSVLGCRIDSGRNAPVALRLSLRTNGGVEVPSQESREIAGRGMSEQQLLRQHAAG